MIKQTQGQIYLAEQRGCMDLSWYRSFRTFNFGEYYDENKAAFGNLVAFNEDTLAAGKDIPVNLLAGTEVILLPVAGGIELRNARGFIDYLTPGDVQILRKDDSGIFLITNPYGLESIHFLQIWIRKGNPSVIKTEPKSFDPDIRNILFTTWSGDHIHLMIGKYTGRKEGVYPLKNKKNGVFVFVIQGAFEVEERLLQPKDGLALWDLEEVEFEALSNDAIILIVEIPLK